jgi:hypothetical protein
VPERNLESNFKAKSSRRVVRAAGPASETQSATSDAQLVQRAVDGPSSKLRSRDVLALQRTVGNRAVQRRLSTPKIQTKLTVGAAHDPLEQEADTVAEQVVGSAPIEPQASATQPAVQRLTVTPSIQRKGGAGRFASEQWEGYQDDMSSYGGMLQQGFVDAPMEAYREHAPTEEDKKKKGIGASLKRGGQHVLGGLAAGATGLISGPLALGLAAGGTVLSTVGRGLAVMGRGIWSGMKKIGKGIAAVPGAVKNRYDLMARKKGKGFDAQASNARTDVGITAGSIINASVNNGISLAEGAGSTASSVAGAVTGPIAVLIGMIKGSVSAARAHRARKRQNIAEETVKDAQLGESAQRQFDEWVENTDDLSVEAATSKRAELHTDNEKFIEAVKFLAGKNKAKKWRSIMESGAAFTGAAGSLALTAGMIAGAVGLTALLASNPVGWGIALGLVGVGVVTAIGYGLFKLINAAVKGDQKGVARRKHSEALFDLAVKNHPLAIQFLKEIGVLKGAPEDKKGKFTLEEFTANKTQGVAHMMSKMRST